MKKALTVCILVFLGIFTQVNSQIPQVITYQGVLTNSEGVFLNGAYDLTFEIYNSMLGGSLLWTETHTAVIVESGVFNVYLGTTSPFNLSFDEPLWLQTQVGTGTPLPRLRFTSSPYAFMAKSVQNLSITPEKIVPGAIHSTHLATMGATNGQYLQFNGTSWLPGNLAETDPVWSSVSGNYYTKSDLAVSGQSIVNWNNLTNVPGNFITTATPALGDLTGFFPAPAIANGRVVKSLNSLTDAVTLTAGSNISLITEGNSIKISSNDANWTYFAAPAPHIKARAGGIASNDATMYGFYANTHVNLGSGNSITGSAGEYFLGNTISGGAENSAVRDYSTVSGGYSNNAESPYSAIGGGISNATTEYAANVGGGANNTASGTYSTIAGGNYNYATMGLATVGGGANNSAERENSTIGGGNSNSTYGEFSTISGGFQNLASGSGSVIGGGVSNLAVGENSVIPGGSMLRVGDRSFGFRGGIGASPLDIIDVSDEPETFHILDANFHFNTNNQAANFIVDGTTSNLLFIDAANNRIGVNTNTPRNLIDVVTNSNSFAFRVGNNQTWMDYWNGANAMLKCHLNEDQGGSFINTVYRNNKYLMELAFFNGTNGYIPVMTLTDERFVGIGTVEPLSKLHLTGGTFLNDWDHVNDQTPSILVKNTSGEELNLDWAKTFGIVSLVSSNTTEVKAAIEAWAVGEAGLKQALYGRANGAGDNIGVYGTAYGGTTNFAGLFDGNVKINGNIDFGDIASTYKINIPNIAANDGKAIANEWVTYSDQRIKTDVENIGYGLKELMQLSAKTYYQHSSEFQTGKLVIKEEKEKTIGLLAQELFKVIPEAVAKPNDDSKQLWGVDYTKLVPVLIKSIQEQQEIINHLQKQIDQIQNKLDSLDKK